MPAAALPYFHVYRIAGVSSYGVLVLAGLALGIAATILPARRYQLPVGEIVALAGVLVAASLIGAHLLDVVANQRAEAAQDASLWWKLQIGISLFGALAAIAIVTPLWCRARKLPLAKVADCIALGWLVALVIGRIGCTLVHDHLGTPTRLPIGIADPTPDTSWTMYTPYADTVPHRLVHDLGFEELLVAIPLALVMWLVSRRLRAGMTAAITALAYAPIRFLLDFHRLPESDPRYASLTAAQWGCLVMTALALYAVVPLRRKVE